MAIVTRRYAFRGANLGAIQLNADPGAALPVLSYTMNVDVTFDDAISDAVVVDTQMALQGFVFQTAAPVGTASIVGVGFLADPSTWTKSQNVAMVPLVDAANIATDASLGNVFSVTLGGNRTLSNPTNLVAGGTYAWIVTQDGAGNRTLAFGALFKWTGGAPVMSTPAGSIDTISAVYDGTVLLASLQKAYA